MGVPPQLGFATCIIVAALVVSGSPAAVRAESQHGSQPTENTPLATNNPTLQASLDRLYAGSAAWREAVAEIGKTGRRAIIVTPDQVRVADPQSGAAMPFDAGVLAEVQPMPAEDLRVDVVVAVVNLPLLMQVHRDRESILDFDADLDRILAHEIYGHAIPYLLAGHLSGKCPDPRPGQRASESCAIQRENAVRAQLGLGRRTEYGLDGLAVASRFRH